MLWIGLVLWLTPAPSASAPLPRECLGDCNEDGAVSIDELVVGVQLALGQTLPRACSAYGREDPSVTVSALVRTVTNALVGCPAGPNFVVILADDLGIGDVGAYGAEISDTPNIDRLAADGIRFTDAHSPSSVCSPTRYALLTGRYGWRTDLTRGVLLPNDPLLVEPGRVTLASMLRRSGYSTGSVGKWHLGFGTESPVNWNAPLRPGPLEVGFQSYFGVPTSHNWPPFVFVDDDGVWGRRPGERIVVVADREVRGIAASRDDSDVDLVHTERATRFIEKHRHRSFFLYFATAAVHSPVTPQANVRDTSDIGPYGDFVAQFDWVVGQIVRTLDRLHLSEHTVLIVTSDNGGSFHALDYDGIEHRSNGPLRGSKGDLYEGGHRVPFVLRWPGVVESGTVSDATISLADLMATFADIVGLSVPNGAGEDSFSFRAAVEGRDDLVRHPVVHHSVNGSLAVRYGDWKLLESANAGGFLDPSNPDIPQLFRLNEDPYEENDIAALYPQKVVELESLLDEIRTSGYRACVAAAC